MQLTLSELRLIKHLLYGREWPKVWLPPDSSIEATDEELRTLGFIPAFLLDKTPAEVLSFMGMELINYPWCGTVDLVINGPLDYCKANSFYLGVEPSIPGANWLKIGEGVWQRDLRNYPLNSSMHGFERPGQQVSN